MSTGQVPSRGRVIRDVLGYAAARLALVVVLTAAIYGVTRLVGPRDFPITVAALLALVVAMPLGMWLFGSLRQRATAGMAGLDAGRRRDREQLHARLRGESDGSDASNPPSV